MDNTYLRWCKQVSKLNPGYFPDAALDSTSMVRRVDLPDGQSLVYKEIHPQSCYVPRLKVLGEIAYALFDYHLDPENRVSPNVCAISPTELWRSYVPGKTGEAWRGDLYLDTKPLEKVDETIARVLLTSPSAQRIALLDTIFLPQGRSASNWIINDALEFHAIDNDMLWPYNGKHTDKVVIRTGESDHLQSPFEALFPEDGDFQFKSGVFTLVYSGLDLSSYLYCKIVALDWRNYISDLTYLCQPLGYDDTLTQDWRFSALWHRIQWLISSRRFPRYAEAHARPGVWQLLVRPLKNGRQIWDKSWETNFSETS